MNSKQVCHCLWGTGLTGFIWCCKVQRCHLWTGVGAAGCWQITSPCSGHWRVVLRCWCSDKEKQQQRWLVAKGPIIYIHTQVRTHNEWHHITYRRYVPNMFVDDSWSALWAEPAMINIHNFSVILCHMFVVYMLNAKYLHFRLFLYVFITVTWPPCQHSMFQVCCLGTYQTTDLSDIEI